MLGKQAIKAKVNKSLLKQLVVLRDEVEKCHRYQDLTEALVHKIRVATKQARAEVVFVLSEQQAKKQKKIARNLAKFLEPMREAHVLLDTLSRVFVASDDPGVKKLQTLLKKRSADQSLDLQRLINLLNRLHKHVAATEVSASSKKRDEQLLQGARKRVEAGFSQLNNRQMESYHDWRKTVKAYLFLLKSLSSKNSQYPRKAIKELAELLGLLHDFHQLQAFTQSMGLDLNKLGPHAHRYEANLLSEIHELRW